MSLRKSNPYRTAPLSAAVLACLATCLALPVHAATSFPDYPLQTGGGSMPRWRRNDGRELYFRANDGTLMAVELGAGANAIEERSAPRPLFVGIPPSGNTPIFTYAAAGDGQRFLVSAKRNSEQPPITVVLNWQQSLASRDGKRP